MSGSDMMHIRSLSERMGMRGASPRHVTFDAVSVDDDDD